ncbi:hypothetical protein BC830DRAFT_1170570 [Chytriomyces sp. MP71]|nr:hypothetical protein BC830DRAFT_1170570 [Chytriomyces sp. MP71]
MEETYSLARHFLSTGKHLSYLSGSDCDVFARACVSEATWRGFCADFGSVLVGDNSTTSAEECTQKQGEKQREEREAENASNESEDKQDPDDGDDDDDRIDSKETKVIDARRAAFAIRSMLYEQCLASLASSSSRGDEQGLSAAMLGHGVLILAQHLASNIEVNKTAPVDEDWTSVPVDDMFYSLEYDTPFIKQYNPEDAPVESSEKRKLRDLQTNLNKKDSGASNPNGTSVAVTTKAGADALTGGMPGVVKTDDPDNLKYLLQVISKHAKPEKEKDLKTLVQRLKKSRSKWAHDYRIGQDVLYEALEKVLTDLKNTTEHSEPFLQKVSKKDAPDYYDIIKKPMDLGTMTKKLNALEYNSKQEFAEDLLLIWSNCLTYNVLPESIYRKKAIAMKRKSLELLKKVPDIKIIIRPQDPDSDSDEDDRASTTLAQDAAKRATTGGKVRRGSMQHGLAAEPTNHSPAASRSSTLPPQLPPARAQSPLLINFDDDEDMAPVAAVPAVKEERLESTPVLMGMGTSQRGSPARGAGGEVSRERTPVKMDVDAGGKEGPSVVQKAEEREGAGPDALVATAVVEAMVVEEVEEEEDYSATADLQNSREHNLNAAFSDRLTVSRLPTAYAEYEAGYEAFRNRNLDRRANGALPAEQGEAFFLPELTNFGTALPAILQPVLKRPMDQENEESLSEYPEAHPDPSSALNASLAKNIEVMRKIKQTHQRLSAKDVAMDQLLVFGAATGYRPKLERHKLPDFVLNEEAAEGIMAQCTSRLLLHTGFDATTQSSVALLTDVGIQYMKNLGKTLRLYADRKEQHQLSPEDMLHRALNVNGHSASDLDVYMRDDIHRHGLRLADLKKRLAMLYKNLLESGNLDPDTAIDFKLGESDAQIMSGNYLDDMGVDFLNLRDLGIDISSIPIELWNRKADDALKIKKRSFFKQEKVEIDTKFHKIDPDTRWTPADPSAVIGLLRPFFEKRAVANDLVDDDEGDNKNKVAARAKAMVKIAIVGRKKPTAVDPGKLAKQQEANKLKEALKKKKEQEKAEKAKLKEEKKLLGEEKRKKKAAGGLAASGTSVPPPPPPTASQMKLE